MATETKEGMRLVLGFIWTILAAYWLATFDFLIVVPAALILMAATNIFINEHK